MPCSVSRRLTAIRVFCHPHLFERCVEKKHLRWTKEVIASKILFLSNRSLPEHIKIFWTDCQPQSFVDNSWIWKDYHRSIFSWCAAYREQRPIFDGILVHGQIEPIYLGKSKDLWNLTQSNLYFSPRLLSPVGPEPWHLTKVIFKRHPSI